MKELLGIRSKPVLCTLLVSMSMLLAPLAAQAWEPNKPIDFVIMAGKGGGADKMARFMQSIV